MPTYNLNLTNATISGQVSLELVETPTVPDAAPSQVPGLLAWLEGSTLEATQWRDQSGNGRHFAAVAGASVPARIENELNGKPVGRFNGSATLLCPEYWFDDAHTVFVVWKQAANVNFAAALSGDASGSVELGVDNSTPKRVAISRAGVATSASDVTAQVGQWNITSWQGGGRGHDNRTAAVVHNNNTVGKGIGLRDLSGAATTYLGSSRGTGGFLIGDIAEWIVYDHCLSEADRKKVNDYLATKYAIGQAAPLAYSFAPVTFSAWTGPKTPIIVRGGSGAFDEGLVEVCAVYKQSGVYYVYYTGWNAAKTVAKIGLAMGTSLTNLVKQGVVLEATPAEWDAGYVSGARLHKFGSTYYLYYWGSPNTGFEAKPGSLGIATAASPLGPFTKHTGNPLLTPGASGTWDTLILYRTFVVENGGTYYLYYNGHGAFGEDIGYATASSPLGPFTKDSGNPNVTRTGDGWALNRIGDPVIHYDATAAKWLMFYFGQTDPEAALHGIAESTDLQTWTKYTGNPIAIACKGAALRPAVFLDDDGKWKAIVDDLRDAYYVECAVEI
jgi:predicted GH43/DUF377 family glycosyl hydrolase